MYVFLIKDYELLEKYNEIWHKFSNNNNKGFGSKPVYKEKSLTTKIKFYVGKF